MAGVRVQAVAARGATNSHWFEPCSFDEDVFCFGLNHRVPSAHHAGEPEGFDMVGNDEIIAIEDALHAVEGLELLALPGAAHDDTALDLVEVEGMRGLAHGEPGEVGGIDGI